MHGSVLFLDLALWYYTGAFRALLALWLNATWFVVHFFSIPLLFKTLFAPWKRMTDVYERRGLEALFATLIMNTMSRVTGALIRLTVIIFGLVMLIFGVVGLIAALVIWVCLPVLAVAASVYGVMLLMV